MPLVKGTRDHLLVEQITPCSARVRKGPPGHSDPVVENLICSDSIEVGPWLRSHVGLLPLST